MILVSDSKAEIAWFGQSLEDAALRVVRSGWFILGEEVTAFEAEFAAYQGVKHAVGVGSGTEALHLALRAAGVVSGDEVITVPNTAVATVSAIEMACGTPVFVDIDPRTYLMDPAMLESAITPRTRVILPVHLHGQVADMDAIQAIATPRGIAVIEDGAQSAGSLYHGRRAGSMGDLGCYSFYPSKNLGALGDGGMVTTNDDAIAERLKLLRQYGWRDRDRSVVPGFNSRLDEMQAAFLRIKLPALDERNRMRHNVAHRYLTAFSGTSLTLPIEIEPDRTNWHLFVVRHSERDRIRKALADGGVATAVHYPNPIYLQEGYIRLGIPAGTCPVSEAAQREILSLPMYPELTEADQDTVIKAVLAAI